LAVQPLPQEAYQEESALLAQLQYVTGINPYISGATSGGTGTDQNTATGVNILNEVASRLLKFKAQQIQYGIWQRTFEQWGNDIQQFMDKALYVRIVGADGQDQFETVTPQDVVGEYDFVLEGVDDSLSKQQERADIVGLVGALAPFIQMGIINPKPLAEKIAAAFNIDNPASLLQAPPQMPPAAPTGPGGGSPVPNGAQPPMLPSGQMMGMQGANQIMGG